MEWVGGGRGGGWGSAHPIGGLQADWLGDDPLNASAVELVCYDAADAVSSSR